MYVGVSVVRESVPASCSLEEVRYGLEYTGVLDSSYERRELRVGVVVVYSPDVVWMWYDADRVSSVENWELRPADTSEFSSSSSSSSS